MLCCRLCDGISCGRAPTWEGAGDNSHFTQFCVRVCRQRGSGALSGAYRVVCCRHHRPRVVSTTQHCKLYFRTPPIPSPSRSSSKLWRLCGRLRQQNMRASACGVGCFFCLCLFCFLFIGCVGWVWVYRLIVCYIVELFLCGNEATTHVSLLSKAKSL